MDDLRDETLESFRREIAFLREQGEVFSSKYPQVATALSLDDDALRDPHMKHLIESFAFLTGRLQRSIDSQHDRIAAELLQCHCRQITEPLPPLSLAHFKAGASTDPASGVLVERGTLVEAQTSEGDLCPFQTCRDVRLWPMGVTSAAALGRDAYDFTLRRAEVAQVVSTRWSMHTGDFSQCSSDMFDFFIGGEEALAWALYDALMMDLADIAIVDKEGDLLRMLPAASLKTAGFRQNEALLPTSKRVQVGQRLLYETLALPEKFRCFELHGMRDLPEVSELQVVFLLRNQNKSLDKIGAGSFLMGVTPVVNLLERQCEPILWTHEDYQAPVVADAENRNEVEVHSLVSVSGKAIDENIVRDYLPLVGWDRELESWDEREEGNKLERYYVEMRGDDGFGNVQSHGGGGVSVGIVQSHASLSDLQEEVLFVRAWCSNQQVASQVRSTDGFIYEGNAQLDSLACLLMPTLVRTPNNHGKDLAQLVAYLSAHQVSVSDGDDLIRQLRQLLGIYRWVHPGRADAIERSLHNISCDRVMRHVGDDAWRGFCKGYRVRLTIDPVALAGLGVMLVGDVLAHILATYIQINTFVELELCSVQQPDKVIKRWEPQLGSIEDL